MEKWENSQNLRCGIEMAGGATWFPMLYLDLRVEHFANALCAFNLTFTVLSATALLVELRRNKLSVDENCNCEIRRFEWKPWSSENRIIFVG